MDLAHPERLLPLGSAAVVVLLVGLFFARRRRPGVVTLLSVALRAALLGGIVFLLLGPRREIVERTPGTLLAALDLSRSVPASAREAEWPRLVAWSEGRPSRLVGFGSRPVRLDPAAGMPAALGAAGDLESRLAPALAPLLLGPEAAGGAARLLVFTDGALEEPDPILPSVGELAPRIVPLAVRASGGFRARALEVRRAPTLEQPGELLLLGSATKEGTAEVVLHLDGREVRRVPLPIPAGDVELPLTLPSGTPGRHLVSVSVSLPGDEPMDDGAASWFRTTGRPEALVVSPSEQPLAQAALRVQNVKTRRVAPEAFVADAAGAIEGAGVVLLDRVDVAALSSPPVLQALDRHLRRGGGLLYLPRASRGEMFGMRERPFLELLPVAGREPPPPPEPEKEEPKKKPDAEGLKPPDPEKRKKEKRVAPSLGLLLLLDSSHSMRGNNLRLAKEAAIAAAEVLHPEDMISVLAFNDGTREVLELTKAAKMRFIVDRIARIRAGGGTDFQQALEMARDTLEFESLAIKHVILLSDGESRPGPLKELVKEMVGLGITVSTVGCGFGFNEQVLSNIAVWGRGKFQPAYSAEEIPQVFTIEAERVIAATGARRRRPKKPPTKSEPEKTPPPQPEEAPPAKAEGPKAEPKAPDALPLRLGLPAPYVEGVAPQDVPGVLGLHDADARRGAWTSLRLEDGRPVAVHGYRGEGRVIAWTLPLEGPWAAHLVSWDDYQVLLAQMVRFLHPDAGRSRFFVQARGRERAVEVRLIDREDRSVASDGVRLKVVDERGRRPDCEVRSLGGGRHRIELAPDDPAVALEIRAESGDGSPPGRGFARVAPPPEIREGGLDLDGLEAWARALDGALWNTPAASLDIPDRVTRRFKGLGSFLLPWILLLLALDLLIKRFFPGSLRS